MDYSKALDMAKDYNEVFRLVKKSVKETLGLSRGGIGLILQDLPLNILGYNQVASNYIVLNRRVVYAAYKRLSRRDFNRFIYVLLLHEYLHTLGFMDEALVRSATNQIVDRVFGADDPIHEYIFNPLPSEVLNDALNMGLSLKPEFVRDFGREELNYIG